MIPSDSEPGTSGTSGLALAGAPRLPKSMLVPARSHSRVRSYAPTRAALSFGRVAAFGAVESRFASIAPAHVPASAHAPAGERASAGSKPDCNNGQICPLFRSVSSAGYQSASKRLRALVRADRSEISFTGPLSNHRHADFQSVVAGSRGLIINHLQRLPAPTPASPRHNPSTPNLSSSRSWHTGGYLDLHGAASLTNACASISIQVRCICPSRSSRQIHTHVSRDTSGLNGSWLSTGHTFWLPTRPGSQPS